MIEKLGLLKKLEKMPSVISHIYVIVVVTIGFVIFSGNSLGEVVNNIIGIFGVGTAGFISKESIYYLLNYLPIFILGIVFSTPIVKNIVIKLSKKMPKLINILEPVTLCILMIVCVSFLVDGSFNPFLYFRF